MIHHSHVICEDCAQRHTPGASAECIEILKEQVQDMTFMWTSSCAEAVAMKEQLAALRAENEALKLREQGYLSELADYGETGKRLRAENERMKAEALAHENAEAAVCPEDVGFVEYIQALKAENERLRAALISIRTAARTNVRLDNGVNHLKLRVIGDMSNEALKEARDEA